MDTFTTPIVNSKTADKHFELMKVQHADLLDRLTNQAIKIADRNKVKDSNAKDEAEQNRKNQELEIKKLALMN